jgi:hypothetical protein
MKAFIVVFLAVLIGIAGCAGSSAPPNNPVFKPTPLHSSRDAMLYLYRPEASTPGMTKPLRFSYPEVLVDGKSVGIIEYNRYLSVELSPGEHTIRLTGLTEKAKDWETRDINRTINVRSGKSKFIRFKVEFNLNQMNICQPVPQYKIFLTPVDEGDAIYEIRHTSPMK